MNIQKLPWSDAAAEALFPVMGVDAPYLQSEVESGVSELYCIDKNTWMITRLEGERLIVCALVGENLKAVAKRIYAAAKRNGCTSIQLHTERPGLRRLLSEFDMTCSGRYYVYEVRVH